MLKYNAHERIAYVHIHGLTDGASDGLRATLAYAIGHDDRDTELQINLPQDVFVFFEGGDTACPVVAFYASHGVGAMVDTRRIRQQNIELLAGQNIRLNAQNKALLTANQIEINAQNIKMNANQVEIKARIEHQGDMNSSGTMTADTDVVAGGKSLKEHTHAVLSKDYGNTGVPL